MSGLKKMFMIFSLIIFILVTVFLAVYIKYQRTINRPIITNQETIRVNIEQGDSLLKIFDKINKEGNLRSLNAVKYYIKQNNISGNVEIGQYEILSNTSLEEMINLFKTGVKNIKITIPEGYTINDIAVKIENSGLVTKDEFIKAVKEYPLPNYIKKNDKKKYNLEGYLFPDTYYFNKNDKAKDVIIAMLSRFDAVIEMVKGETGINITREEFDKYITIASIIEKEAKVDADRRLIASVIENRIAKDMPLQIDATVLYALGQHKELITYDDLKINSPYNTYKVKGLPVGPIANPGKKSIIAALTPEKTNYIYYILQKDNSHYFTNSYSDFLKKKKELGY